MMLSLNLNVVGNLFCKHVTEFAGVMLGSKLLVEIAYPARNLVGRVVQSWHAFMRLDWFKEVVLCIASPKQRIIVS